MAAAAGAAMAIPAHAADTVVTIPAGTAQTTPVTASPAAGDTFTLNILGSLRGVAGAANIAATSIQGSGAGAVFINNDGRLQGPLNFTNATGPVTLTNTTGANAATTGWHSTGAISFGSGDDRIENTASGVIALNAGSTINFGAGIDSFVNAGRLIVGREIASVATVTLNGLETFENSGLILLGSPFGSDTAPGTGTDGAPNDRLIAQGVAFTGSGASRIYMDASLGLLTQDDCAVLTAADCVDFTGGSTAGSTLLTIWDTNVINDPAFNSGITLIVGSSAAEHFTLDPDTVDYSAQTSLGGVIQKGLVSYALEYDAAGQRHMLVGLLADEALQASTFAASSQEVWRATTGSWFTQQADLRATPGGLERSGGIWARLGASSSERDLQSVLVQHGADYAYDLSHSQRTAHLVFGMDFLGASSQQAAWVVGGMLGLVRADVQYDATPTEVINRGLSGGLYGSYVAGPLFVDATINLNLLEMNLEAPNMHLGQGVNLTQDIRSVGGQVEAGWRLQTGTGLFIEPLVAASFVETEQEDLVVEGVGTIDFQGGDTSLRTGAGLRVGLDSRLLGFTAAYSLTGRHWVEAEGENVTLVRITNGDTTTSVVDEFGGGFSELAGSLNLYSDDGGLSGFVSLGGRFADDYRAVDVSAGVRVRW